MLQDDEQYSIKRRDGSYVTYSKERPEQSSSMNGGLLYPLLTSRHTKEGGRVCRKLNRNKGAKMCPKATTHPLDEKF